MGSRAVRNLLRRFEGAGVVHSLSGVCTLVLLAHAAGAQPVLLQIRPHIGDTLRMHLSQTVEVTGTTRGA